MNDGKLRIDNRLRLRREIDKNLATISGVRATLDEAPALQRVEQRRHAGGADKEAFRYDVGGQRASRTVEDRQRLERAGGQIGGLSRCTLYCGIERSRGADKCRCHLSGRSAGSGNFVLEMGRHPDDRVVGHDPMLRP